MAWDRWESDLVFDKEFEKSILIKAHLRKVPHSKVEVYYTTIFPDLGAMEYLREITKDWHLDATASTEIEKWVLDDLLRKLHKIVRAVETERMWLDDVELDSVELANDDEHGD